ncbi:ROK family protein [Chloroflexota bacterium]
MSVLIAVDIGGTKMRAASYPINGLFPIKNYKIKWSNSPESPIDILHGLIKSVWVDNDEVKAISIASPGPIEPESGFIYDAPNIPGWTQFPLGEILRKTYPVPIFFGNDANLAVYGEWKYGAGIGHSNIFYITISTGIGGGIICNDQMIMGEKGLAAEIGHVIVQPDGPICSCGKKGHLEAFASGTAIVDYVKTQINKGHSSIVQFGSDLSAFDIANAAKQGDDLSIKAITRAGEYIGIALASFVHIFNPSVIILGGGVAQTGKLISNSISHGLKNEVINPIYLEDLEVVPAKFGDDSGLLGALAYARHTLGIK